MRVSRILVFLFVVLVSISASAQATRTWVSNVGDDVNPCSYTAPCKTFAGAISKTAKAGVITVKDAGSYGSVTITQSITIDGGGNFAGITHGAGNGIYINFTADDFIGNTVILRGLTFEGAGSWGYGVFVTGTSPAHVHLENVKFNRPGCAVEVRPSAGEFSLKMNNVEVTRPLSTGILSNPTGAASVKLSLNDVRVSRTSPGGGVGLYLKGNTNGVISNSSFEHCKWGVYVETSSVHVSLVRSIIANNTTGFEHFQGGSTTLLDGCSIMSNGTAIENTGSTVIGFGNNAIGYNNTGVVGNPIQTLQGQ